ncbi:helix-turn-helix domain-containing protein [Streptomyces sp. NPDC127106]|uniref:helix-turn-helix domain-containing protein n=1 Tax=Streptomyces sp. NPDC127106 TaxID=3345360 RepID=UPI003629770D
MLWRKVAMVNEESHVAARPLSVVGGDDLPEIPGAFPPSRTVRQLLGGRMKALRKAAGLTLADVVRPKDLVQSSAVLSRIENGKTNVTITRALVDGLLARYGVSDPEEKRVARLRVEQLLAGDTAWWAAHDGLVVGAFADLLHMEAAAERITMYESMFVPGLLQVSAYMDVVLTHACLSEEERELAERRRQLRKERQRLLDAPGGREFTAIIDEAVLRRTVGSRQVMREQLRHLFSLCENRESVHIRVFPSSAWEQAVPMAPSVTLLQFARERECADMLYADTAGNGGSWLDESGVEMVKAALEQVRSHALGKQETLDFLDRRIAELVDPR